MTTIVKSYVVLREGAPVVASLPAVIGTAAIILSPESRISRHVLSSSPMQLVGRFSYDAYLVHWPTYVFSRHLAMDSSTSAVLMLGLTAAFAVLLRNSVEQPFCKSRPHFVFAALVLIVASVSVSAVLSGGWKSRNGGKTLILAIVG